MERDVENRHITQKRVAYQRAYDKTPRGRYRQQKGQAQQRGINWGFTFESWWTLWQESGHWSDRGRTYTSYVMSRHGDTGPYSPQNVFIQRANDNTSQGPHNKAGLPRGVKHHSHRKGFQAFKHGIYLGYFKTVKAAQEAYETHE